MRRSLGILVLAALACGADKAEKHVAKPAGVQSRPAEDEVRGVPAIGHVLRIHVGADTLQKVEKLYGPGLACLGGHGDGGRMWREKATGWAIYLDSVENGAGGRVVSYAVMGDPNEVVFPVEASGAKGKTRKPPAVAIRSRSMSLDQALRPGMPKSEATKVIATKGWPCKADGDAQVIRMGGTSQVSKQVKFTDWEATLMFKKERLVQVAVRVY